MIKNDQGQWISDKDELKALAINFFTNLYTNDAISIKGNLIPNDCPCIDIDKYHVIERSVDDEEICATVFSMKPLKAPRIDGLHAIFYQSQWKVVGKSACKQIIDIFNGRTVPDSFNKTLIVLIPKTDNPTSLKLFRPISLCTVMSKTIIKIIANRLKTFLPNLVGPHQTSFVLGRHIIENIILT